MDKAILPKESLKPEWFDPNKLAEHMPEPENCQIASAPILPAQEPNLYCPRCGNLCCPYETGDEYAA